MNNKPLTAEDLVIGGKYVPLSKSTGCLSLEEIKRKMSEIGYEYLIYKGERYKGNFHFAMGVSEYIFIPSDVTPYTEPNQTTMNTDYTEQTFNLETALKHPEWVYFRNGEKPLEWHWFEKAQTIAIADKVFSYRHVSGLVYPAAKSEQGQDLILRVPYVEKWANLYDNLAYLLYNTKEEADCYHTKGRIACVPVKIPAI
jgi:hypothetical protein